MKLMVLALDYDGTITTGDRPDPEVLTAIEEIRRQGVVVVLVTGRRIADLQRAAGDLRFLDAVVAENGGILAFPHDHRTIQLGQAPPAIFLEELKRRGIPAEAGQCLVETDARHAVEVLSVIRDLEVPLVLLFNLGRLMILPQGISKATGLHAALRRFRLSEHNAIAIGDAENDHALLKACEIGAAVEWGS